MLESYPIQVLVRSLNFAFKQQPSFGGIRSLPYRAGAGLEVEVPSSDAELRWEGRQESELDRCFGGRQGSQLQWEMG